ncbi:MAG: IPTL-CTERM sorting domain-containing protein [Thermoanaerobaculia bacterium]|nr:IPTL-CTERM sorting domain-containing protein [Thermoanaerobaculia bacterium]
MRCRPLCPALVPDFAAANPRPPARRSAARRRILGFAVGLWLALAGVASAAISGTVFRDYDADGSRDLGEPGIGGIVVNAYGALGTAVGNSPQTTAADGSYSLSSLPAGPLRLEFTLPAALAHFRPGAAGATSVVFTTDGATVDSGFQLPVEFCEADPTLFTTCFITFDNLNAIVDGGAYDHRAEPVSVAVAYSANSTTPATSLKVPAEDMGSTFGVAWQSATGRLFTASYVKSIAGLGPDGAGGTTTGGLYEVTPGGGGTASAALFVDLDGFAGISTGADPHPSPTATCTSGIIAGTTNLNCWLHDPASFAAVGKRGLADLDFNSDETRLYTVNLNDRTLVMLPVGVPAVVPPAGAVEVFPTPSNCANAADARPFALARHDHPNRMYLGVTCTAQSSQAAADLAVWIYEFDRGTGPGTETYTAVFNGSLAYPRLRATGFFGGNCTAANCPATWRPWQDDFTLTNQHNENASLAVVSHPQPLVTDFAFQGLDLVLAIRDRSADQGGDRSGSPANIADTLRRSWFSAGDLVRACDSDGNPATAGWTFEANGTCGGVNGSGIGNGDGFGTAPNNGEFFFDEILTGGAPGHSELFFGSVAQIPGRDTLGVTMMDATAFNEGVVSTWRHTNGSRATAARVYLDGFDPFFGKANGLGDLEALCAPAPLELGNRLWCDFDRDGVQDPAEPGANLVAVRLQCGAGNPVTVVTAGNGNYLFTDALYGAANGGADIPRNAACTISVETAGTNGAAITAACGGIFLSPPNNGGADSGADLRDSDGTLSGTVATIAVTTGGPGANNHSLDQGFGATDFGDAPDTYGTTLGANGPHHTIIPGFSLGGTEDGEPDGQPNASANGDGADEDGVVIVGGMPGACSTGNALTVTLTNTAGAATPRLDAWIDWNGDGDFDHPAEHLFGGPSANLATGVNNLTYSAPCAAVAQATSYARFRLSSAGSLTPLGGPAANGEVEDYTLRIKGADFGDAPAPYPTLFAADGARHTVLDTGNPTLGSVVDIEPEGAPDVKHLGDDLAGVPDDEDGVSFAGVLIPGASSTVTVTTGATGGVLNAWIDWNRDGDWSDAGEQIASNQAIAANQSMGLAVAVPVGASQGASCSRFRLSTASNLTPIGQAPDGEVEDHLVAIGAEEPGIGVSKRAVSVTETATDNVFDVVYEVKIVNTGNVTLSAVQATADLATAFAAATSYSAVSVTSSDLTVNPGFNGGSNILLLSATDSLGVGEMGTVTLTVRITPGSNPGPYLCSSFASGSSPSGTPVDDDSQDGNDPDPDDDGDPTNNDDPTVVTFSINVLEIPTASEWGLLLLALALGLVAVSRLRR